MHRMAVYAAHTATRMRARRKMGLLAALGVTSQAPPVRGLAVECVEPENLTGVSPALHMFGPRSVTGLASMLYCPRSAEVSCLFEAFFVNILVTAHAHFRADILRRGDRFGGLRSVLPASAPGPQQQNRRQQACRSPSVPFFSVQMKCPELPLQCLGQPSVLTIVDRLSSRCDIYHEEKNEWS